MNDVAVSNYICTAFAEVETQVVGGYTFFFYGSERMMPFATLATRDDVYDRASNLDRPGVYRLNLGVDRDTYIGLFGAHPGPPGESEVVETGHDWTALDTLMPHPVYAPQSWICVLCPSAETFAALEPLLTEAYERAVTHATRRS